METLLQEMVSEQRKTNELLLLLIDALGEEGGEPDAEPSTYLDGTPASG